MHQIMSLLITAAGLVYSFFLRHFACLMTSYCSITEWHLFSEYIWGITILLHENECVCVVFFFLQHEGRGKVDSSLNRKCGDLFYFYNFSGRTISEPSHGGKMREYSRAFIGLFQCPCTWTPLLANILHWLNCISCHALMRKLQHFLI